jgi:5,10-methylenetetrahydromethanopterin reductase
MKLSVLHYAHESLREILDIAEATDALGFDGWYVVDSTYRKDVWVTLAIGAHVTKRVRIGPSAARLALTDPLVVARALATLDELSGGRVDAVLGVGGGTLPREERPLHPVRFMREATEAIRQALTRDRIDFDGSDLSYHFTSMPLTARPVQSHLPLWIGTMGGAQLMRLAGAVADGMHIAPAYTRAACEYAVQQVQAGAERAGRNWHELDIAMNPIIVCSEDPDIAREVARVHAAFYLSGLSRPFFRVINDASIPESTLDEIGLLWRAGKLPEAAARVPMELANLIAIAGTPQECLESIQQHVLNTGINHLVLMLADSRHVEMILGEQPRFAVPTILEQLELISKHILPVVQAST